MNRFNKSAKEQTKFNLKDISARVDRVNISGLLRTQNDYVLKAADGLFKATNFQEILTESLNAKSYLHELGIFKDVSVKIDISRGDNATPNGYEITLKGVEVTRLLGSVGTEVGQNEGSLRTELSVPNLFGRGESLSVQAAYSNTRASDIQIKFWKCYFHTCFMENRPEISFSLFRRLDPMNISSFQNLNLGGLTDLTFNTFYPIDITHSLQYEASVRELSLLNKNVPFIVREQCGPKLASLVRYTIAYDGRDSAVFPTQGIMTKLTNEYCGLGGNVGYVSSTAHAEISLPLISDFVFQMCGRIGILKETKRTTILPITNKFYCGGPLTLRGFTYGGAGPVVDGTPIGADTYWSTGLHLWAPLPFPKVFKGLASNIRSHLFYNVGNYNSFSTDTMRSAAGFGIAIKLAERARIEFNYCVPITKHPTDKPIDGFQFGIGYEFV